MGFVRRHPIWTAVVVVLALVLLAALVLLWGEGSGSTGVGSMR
jgi:hypothetical protein